MSYAEVTDFLKHKPEELFVYRIVCHKYIVRDKSGQMELAVIAVVSVVKSYVGAFLVVESVVNNYVDHLFLPDADDQAIRCQFSDCNNQWLVLLGV